MTERIDLKALKEAAEKAKESGDEISADDANFIAQASPANVLALVAVVEAAQMLAEGQAGNAWPEMVALRTALHPFTVTT